MDIFLTVVNLAAASDPLTLKDRKKNSYYDKVSLSSKKNPLL